jgi:hypothetical protein
METKHTPGPWEWTGNALDQKENPYKEVIGTDVHCGGYCLGGQWSPHISDADKALIAAAPDLLAALEQCITEEGAHCLQHQGTPRAMSNRLRSINDIARAAIAKARGEGAV